MHIQTHLMSGWCIANCFKLTARERTLAMLAAALADLDGLSIFGGVKCYQQWHHVITHNLPFALLLSAILAAFSPHRLKAPLLYLGLAHLHLLLDYLGSGIWKIYYLWPLDRAIAFQTPATAWEFSCWQNTTFALGFLAWTIAIAVFQRRTPLEAIMPSLDRQLISLVPEKSTKIDRF